MGVLVGTYDVPHLGLALGAVVPPGCERVIRMHLDGKVLPGVYELDKEGKFLPGPCIVGLSYQAFPVLTDKLRYGLPVEGASGYDGFVAFDTRQLPAFPDVVLVGLYILERGYLLAAPHEGLQYRPEF